MKLRGYNFIIAAAVLWGILGPFSRLAFSEGISPPEVAFWRAVLAWGFFTIHAGINRSIRLHIKDLPMVTLFAITGITLFYGSYQFAVRSGGAALAAVLLYTAPAWVTIMARFTFKELITPLKLLALVLTLAGVVLVARGGDNVQISAQAVGFGLAAGFCYSLYYIFGKYFSSRYSSPTLFFYLLPIGAITIVPWVEFTAKTPVAWVALICIAALSTYSAYFFYYQGLKYLEASRAAITATLEPVVAAAVAFFWWDETFVFAGYLGSALILTAVLLMIWDPERK